MSQTRSRTRQNTQNESETIIPTINNEDATEIVVDQASFSTSLKRYRYDLEDESSLTPMVGPIKKPKIRSSSSSLTLKPTTVKKSGASKKKSGYAPPSTYATHPPLTDILTPNLIAVFIGTNPGLTTSLSGHAYAHPSNLFWKLLHSSGCTTSRLQPVQDVDLPRLFALGNTNIVSRATRDASELSKAEMVLGAGILDEKIQKYKPEAVCVVGKGIWEAIFKWRTGRGLKKDEFKWGWQDEEFEMGMNEEGWKGARVYVTTSTSGLSASLKPKEKEEIWKPFGEWVAMKRKEREIKGIQNPRFEGESKIDNVDGEAT